MKNIVRKVIKILYLCLLSIKSKALLLSYFVWMPWQKMTLLIQSKLIVLNQYFYFIFFGIAFLCVSLLYTIYALAFAFLFSMHVIRENAFPSSSSLEIDCFEIGGWLCVISVGRLSHPLWFLCEQGERVWKMAVT